MRIDEVASISQISGCVYRKLDPDVVVMKSAENGP